jgi:hypothetical protein
MYARIGNVSEGFLRTCREEEPGALVPDILNREWQDHLPEGGPETPKACRIHWAALLRRSSR